jgi:hypothetical protein
MKDFRTEQVINGTWGEIWYDGEYMAELISCKAEVNYKKSEIQQVQKMAAGQKITGLELKGEFKIHHVNSTVLKKEQKDVRGGKTPTHTIISNIDDPDALGAERITYFNCVLDKLVLADFESGKTGERTYSFTFDDWDVMEKI